MTGPCRMEGCENAAVVRGICNRHYQAWYRQNRADRKRDSDRRWRARTNYNATHRKPQHTRACAERGEPFTTPIPHKRFCSKRCKKRAENHQRRAAA